MLASLLFRIAAVLLGIAALGHTFGGMLGTAKRGAQAGAEADRVLSEMKNVSFSWRGAQCTWFGFWMGNGLAVSALFIAVVPTLWLLGNEGFPHLFIPLAWCVSASLVAVAALSFRYFVPRIGIVFGLIAALVVSGAVLRTIGE